MKLQKILISLAFLTLSSCASSGPKLGSGMGMSPHKPNLDNTLVINKRDGQYRISTIKSNTSAIDKILNGDLMSCNSTTFSMPRGNTVASFMREVFENELTAARKLSLDGTGISVAVKAMTLDMSAVSKGSWTMIVEYTENDKSMTIETVTSFESKVSILSSCTNTADVFEEALADNFVEYFKRQSKK